MNYFENEEIYLKKLLEINSFINKFGINKTKLAEQIGIPDSTFRLRLSCNTLQYKFRIEEFEKLLKIIKIISEEAIIVTI